MVGPPLRLGVEADEECTCLYEESGRVGNQDLDLLHVEEGLHGPGDASTKNSHIHLPAAHERDVPLAEHIPELENRSHGVNETRSSGDVSFGGVRENSSKGNSTL